MPTTAPGSSSPINRSMMPKIAGMVPGGAGMQPTPGLTANMRPPPPKMPSGIWLPRTPNSPPSYGRYHPTFNDFRAAVQYVLDRVSLTHAEKLASLMTLNFRLAVCRCFGGASWSCRRFSSSMPRNGPSLFFGRGCVWRWPGGSASHLGSSEGSSHLPRRSRQTGGGAFLIQTDFLLRACLLAAGFHSHRGSWRRRRIGFRETGDPLPHDLPALMKRAGQGDVQASGDAIPDQVGWRLRGLLRRRQDLEVAFGVDDTLTLPGRRRPARGTGATGSHAGERL
jgi:hypothetical protein